MFHLFKRHKRKYLYFISFVYWNINGKSGYGHTTAEGEKIKTLEDIKQDVNLILV